MPASLAFCASCHPMETRFVSWQRSAHGTKATCLQCHSRPGSTGELKARLRAARYLYVSATGAKAGDGHQRERRRRHLSWLPPVRPASSPGWRTRDRPCRSPRRGYQLHHLPRWIGARYAGRHCGQARDGTCQECHSSTTSAALAECSSCHRESQAGFVGLRSPGSSRLGGPVRPRMSPRT